jgi:exosortase A-associated hydrolase 2
VSRGAISGQFLGAPGRRIFVLLREPEASVRTGASVLVVPPFGEEMNKSRRMITDAAQRLCDMGLAVVLPDFYGTGDSEGEFRETQVERWVEDLDLACRYAEGRGSPVQAVLAVRLGCALAVAGARRGAIPAVAASVWWQPVLEGRRHLAQFLRLRVAAANMRGDTEETVDRLRARSSMGEVISVAGYELSPALVQGLEGLSVDGLPSQAGELHWFEFVRDAGAAPPLPAVRFVERASAAGARASITTLVAEPFWASTEIVRVPDAVEYTVAALARAPATVAGRPSAESRVKA